MCVDAGKKTIGTYLPFFQLYSGIIDTNQPHVKSQLTSPRLAYVVIQHVIIQTYMLAKEAGKYTLPAAVHSKICPGFAAKYKGEVDLGGQEAVSA